jgi:hypothetical protein
MLPESMVKSTGLLAVNVDNVFPAETKKRLQNLCQNDKNITSRLSKLWVKQLNIRVSRCEQIWEFDELSRTAYINLTLDKTSDPGECSIAVNDILQSLTGTLSRRLGISF